MEKADRPRQGRDKAGCQSGRASGDGLDSRDCIFSRVKFNDVSKPKITFMETVRTDISGAISCPQKGSALGRRSGYIAG